MLPASEVVYLAGFPARVDGVTAVGSTVNGKVMTVSAGRLAVNGYLQESQKGLVRAGQKVEILSEATGFRTSASVRSVADSIAAGQPQGSGDAMQSDGGSGTGDGGGSGEQGYLMVVVPDKALPADAVGQDVRLTVEAASTKGEALVVPVTAITAGSDGKTVVTVRDKDGRQHRVEVIAGTSGDGYVEVNPTSSGQLSEGDEVVTGVKSADSGGQR